MATYNYLNQAIQSSLLIVPKDNDPFFFPTQLALSGYASDGQLYDNGVLATAPFGPFQALQASWFLEAQNPYRGPLPTFPRAALVLLSDVALTILDETNTATTSSGLPLWIQFLLNDLNALTDNFENAVIGFTPTGLSYGGGILAVTYTPDAGSTIQSAMTVNVDFTGDGVYLDVAVTP
jgi:hypothetical protein